jgi:hypothetical protein
MPCALSSKIDGGTTAPAARQISSSDGVPRVANGTWGSAPCPAGSRTNPMTSGACDAASAINSSPPLDRPAGTADSHAAPSAAGQRKSRSANRISTAVAAGLAAAIASISAAVVARGHGHDPTASSDRRSISTTTTRRALESWALESRALESRALGPRAGRSQ